MLCESSQALVTDRTSPERMNREFTTISSSESITTVVAVEGRASKQSTTSNKAISASFLLYLFIVSSCRMWFLCEGAIESDTFRPQTGSRRSNAHNLRVRRKPTIYPYCSLLFLLLRFNLTACKGNQVEPKCLPVKSDYAICGF